MNLQEFLDSRSNQPAMATAPQSMATYFAHFSANPSGIAVEILPEKIGTDSPPERDGQNKLLTKVRDQGYVAPVFSNFIYRQGFTSTR